MEERIEVDSEDRVINKIVEKAHGDNHELKINT
jgi:hypothetical protein